MMIPLLKRITVLLLATFTTCDASLPNASLTRPEKCQVTLTVDCALDLLNQMENRTAQELSQEAVEYYLNEVMNITNLLKDNSNYQKDLRSYGSGVLDVTEKLVSALVRQTDTIDSISISLQSLEVQVIMVGQNTSVNEIPSLITNTASIDIEWTGILQNNNGSAAVAFVSYTNMEDILMFNRRRILLSVVVSVTLPQTTKTHLTTPVNLTFAHIRELEGLPSCVSWNETMWVEDGCSHTETNRTHTVCSCDHLSTFTIIMEPYRYMMYIFWFVFSTVSVAVGMLFLTLSILTFIFCRRNTKENTTALVNLCINLLLGQIVEQIRHHHVCRGPRCKVCAGLWVILSFFCSSAFMWMFIEAVLLFIFVKNLSKIRVNQRTEISWKWLIVIGYFFPLVFVVTSEVLEWRVRVTFTITMACIILGANALLCTITIIILIFNLIHLKNQTLQTSNPSDTKLIVSVIFKGLAQYFILGCSWITLYIPHNDSLLYIVFELITSQQGTFIFLVHCLLNHEVRQQYRKFLSAFCCFKNHNSTTEDVQLPQGTA